MEHHLGANWKTEGSLSCVIPVAKPLLPSADKIADYLRRVDTNRWYSNFGPLSQEFETRLSGMLAARASAAVRVVTASNGTQALTAALLALTASDRGHTCLLPSWTFAATGHAVLSAGLEPVLADVDLKTASLTPEGALTAIEALGLSPAAVVAVSAFGRPVDLAAWDRFSESTGIPVVVDAAAGFDSLVPGRTPAVVSLHATKILAAGEGGFIATTDAELAETIRRQTNFGFSGDRQSQYIALNAKMSEYTAAVALAALDAHSETRTAFKTVARHYVEALGDLPDVDMEQGFGTDWVSTSLIVRLGRLDTTTVVERLARLRVEARRWWQDGLHAMPAFRGRRCMPLPHTEELARRTIGLPFAADMTEDDVARVRDALEEALIPRCV